MTVDNSRADADLELRTFNNNNNRHTTKFDITYTKKKTTICRNSQHTTHTHTHSTTQLKDIIKVARA